VIDPVRGKLDVKIYTTLILMFTNVFAFYSIGLFIFPLFWNTSKILLVVFVFLSFLTFTTLDYFDFKYLLPSLGGENYYEGYSLTRIFWKSLYSYSLVGVPGIAYFFTNLSLEQMRIQSENEKALLVRELSFLRNQFNSHITFNFLNYCYSNVYQYSEKTADAIELFSNMLRYSLIVKPEEMVSLSREIQYINDFIELQKLLTNKICVELICEGETDSKVILSRILITFVENAFKHGQINNDIAPIRIRVACEYDAISLNVSNKINSKHRISSTGVGQENVKKSLEMFYAGRYLLTIDDDKETYVCNLKIIT
jgi:hypothetical protein